MASTNYPAHQIIRRPAWELEEERTNLAKPAHRMRGHPMTREDAHKLVIEGGVWLLHGRGYGVWG